jgi:uncharacterized membrane protein
MPLSPIGILHTIIGAIAVFCGIKMLWQNKRISSDSSIGKIYLITTLITAGSALTIFKFGTFNAAHGLAILTLLAVIVGFASEKTMFLKSWTKYFVNLCYSGTILFHLIPTATEILTRFPMDEPLVTSFEDPLLHKTFLSIFVVFLIMFALQLNWLRKQD